MTPERILEFIASRLLVRDPLDRAAAVLGDRWSATLDSLRLASATRGTVAVGPVACALRGSPAGIDEPRVGLIGRWTGHGAVIEQLMGAGAMQVGFDTAPRGAASREQWLSASGASVSVGWLVGEREAEVTALLETTEPVEIPGGGVLQLPTAAALRDRAAASRWPADNALVPGLDAVLGAERRRAAAPAGAPARIALDPTRTTVDRSIRPEHAGLSVPFTGTLPAAVRRAAAAGFKQLVVRTGDVHAMRAAELDATDSEIRVSVAGVASVIDEWLDRDDLLAAIVFTLDDAYGSTADQPNVNA
ncbi:MAG: hypothetical protein AAGC46_00205 [Solirubrobacteraceae bacterium]|nr:hypothetical protein [Patulibacter sp.]